MSGDLSVLNSGGARLNQYFSERCRNCDIHYLTNAYSRQEEPLEKSILEPRYVVSLSEKSGRPY